LAPIKGLNSVKENREKAVGGGRKEFEGKKILLLDS